MVDGRSVSLNWFTKIKQTERKEIPAFVRGFFIFELMINKLYKRISRIIALLCSKEYDGRKDFEDADRLYRWLTEHYEK